MSDPRNRPADPAAPDEALSQAYRNRSNETPPADLDAQVLAAAHRAVGSGPQRHARRWFRWIDAPVATAAVVVVSATLVLIMRESAEPGIEHVVREEAAESRPTAATEPTAAAPMQDLSPNDQFEADDTLAAPEQPIPAPTPGGALDQQGLREQREDWREYRDAAPAPPAAGQARQEQAPEPFPSPQASAEPESEDGIVREAANSAGARDDGPVSQARKSVEKKRARALQEDAGSYNAGNADPAAAPDSIAAPGSVEVQPAPERAAAGLESLRTPEQWLEDIRKLLRDGKRSDARAALAEFKRVYPDYRLPDDLQTLSVSPPPP